MSAIESFLFERFGKMPLAVRVVTYLVLLALFVYLVLVPKFIDGRIVVKDPQTGGVLPYRGGKIQMQIEGRPYKFTANEDGYWSIPRVSMLPGVIKLQVFHEDNQQWFDVELGTWNSMANRECELVISPDKPFVRLAATGAGMSTLMSAPGAAVSNLAAALMPDAHAAELSVPRQDGAELPSPSREQIHAAVIAALSAATGKPAASIGADLPFTAEAGFPYVAKLRAIDDLERKLALRIPDDHWTELRTVGELVDYTARLAALNVVRPQSGFKSWATYQQSFPVSERPVFRK